MDEEAHFKQSFFFPIYRKTPVWCCRPSHVEFDAFERYILETSAANWEEHGGFIVRPPSSLKADYQLMADLRKQNVTPLQQVYTPQPSKRDGVFLLTDLKDR